MSRQFHLMVISPEDFLKNEITSVKKLFDSGLKTLHLRKPNATEEELRKFLELIPQEFRGRIVIHNHYVLIKEFKLKGAHLPEHARKIYRSKNIKVISTSFHSVKKLKQSIRKYKYIFLSPVFESISKEGYKSNFALEDLKPLLKKYKNIIALGGITDKNITSVKQTGFSGAATIGYIWQGKPVSNYKKLVSKIQ